MRRGIRIVGQAAVALLLTCSLVPAAQARTVKQKKQAARVLLEGADRMRDALLGTPESDREHRDYAKVIDAYRKVYYTAPSYARADQAVLAVAELLDDEGRVFNDAKSYKDAIGQLAFLRREYPGSGHRVEALFTIGEIYRDDLKDQEQAKATFQDFLKRYPNSKLAAKAKQALAPASEEQKPRESAKKGRGTRGRVVPELEPKAAWAEARPRPRANDAASKTRSRARTADEEDDEASDAAIPSSPESGDVAASAPGALPPLNHLPRLTSIRHWSTPDYVRVAIDLEQEVKYQSGRVPRPDRIFFDIYGVKLASDLVGKTFDVEVGFLHKIRVAQYRAGKARIVLDVDDVAEYSAFLLPNPYRLIIDIHGKLPANQTAAARPNQTNAAGPGNQNASDGGSLSGAATTSRGPASHSQGNGNQENTVAAALERAEQSRGGPIKNEARASVEPKTELSRNSQGAGAATSEPHKIIVDEDAEESASAEATTKPTTGPTYQAVAPLESSRNKTGRGLSDHSGKNSLSPATTRAASPAANGERSLIRTLGLKIGKIVVDAGHGGYDTGTIGPNGLAEKDLVLDVAHKLGKELEERLGAEVVYTREDDTFIPLETRTAIANKEQADLFISIHANSSSDPSARGVETYYLNFTSSQDALETAARENAVSEKSIHELQDLVKKIALKEKIEESREFAADVQKSLFTGLNAKNPGIRNRGVKKAPFIVLIGADMPSILAEISFVSNPGDEQRLRTSEFRQRIADSLYKGVSSYIHGLSGIRVAASRVDRGDSADAAGIHAK